MTNAEHMLLWAENDRPSYDALRKLAVPGNFLNPHSRYICASNMVRNVWARMKRSGDMQTGGMSGYDEYDMAQAVVLFLNWKYVE